jgi:hypothetical protein
MKGYVETSLASNSPGQAADAPRPNETEPLQKLLERLARHYQMLEQATQENRNSADRITGMIPEATGGMDKGIDHEPNGLVEHLHQMMDMAEVQASRLVFEASRFHRLG